MITWCQWHKGKIHLHWHKTKKHDLKSLDFFLYKFRTKKRVPFFFGEFLWLQRFVCFLAVLASTCDGKIYKLIPVKISAKKIRRHSEKQTVYIYIYTHVFGKNKRICICILHIYHNIYIYKLDISAITCDDKHPSQYPFGPWKIEQHPERVDEGCQILTCICLEISVETGLKVKPSHRDPTRFFDTASSASRSRTNHRVFLCEDFERNATTGTRCVSLLWPSWILVKSQNVILQSHLNQLYR